MCLGISLEGEAVQLLLLLRCTGSGERDTRMRGAAEERENCRGNFGRSWSEPVSSSDSSREREDSEAWIGH